MGYMFIYGCCIACKKSICFNPDHVPSIRVNGNREPLCPDCFDTWNGIHRTSKGLEPLSIHPEAYEPQEVP